MKRLSSQFRQRAPFIKYGVLVFVMAGVGIAGAHLLGISSAATSYSHNPIGTADYCVLEGNTTVLYGWAHDPDAPAGALPNVLVVVGNTSMTVPTNQAGYRDSAINTYITTTYPGMPTSSVYGWRLALNGLYKGTTNKVAGTLINYGTGVSTVLPVNSSTYVGGTYFTSSKTIPDACLANAPTPAPTPTPTPTPAPVPAPSKTNPKTPVKSSAPAATPAPASAADASLTIGTSAVSLKIPADNATTVRVQYGLASTTLDQTTVDQATNGADTTVSLTGLAAKTAYSFQIVRTQGTQTATSPAANFITKGYNLALLFTTGQNKPVAGIKAELGRLTATSDKNGKLSFNDLSAGSYSPAFSYRGHSHSQTFNTYALTPSTQPITASLQQTINLDKLATVAAKPTVTPKHSIVLPIIASVIGFLLLAAIIWFIIRRRSSNALDDPLPPPALIGGTDIIDQQSHHRFAAQNPPPSEPLPPNIGKSLREMVIESMRQEAAKRKDQPPQ